MLTTTILFMETKRMYLSFQLARPAGAGVRSSAIGRGRRRHQRQRRVTKALNLVAVRRKKQKPCAGRVPIAARGKTRGRPVPQARALHDSLAWEAGDRAT